MLIPKKLKFKKQFKGRMRDCSSAGTKLVYGAFGLKCLTQYRINAKQVESARRVINRSLSKSGKIWIRVFADIPVSKKPADVRMGKGKGSVEEYVFRMEPGRILFEIDGVSEDIAVLALKKASKKLPFKSKVIFRENYL